MRYIKYIAIGAAVVVLIVVLAGAAFLQWAETRRVVTEFGSTERIIDECVVPWAQRTFDRHYTAVYHPESGVMIEVVKNLPGGKIDAPVRLHVTRYLVPPDPRYCPRNWGDAYESGRYKCWTVSVDSVPPAHQGQVLEDVDCAGSLNLVRNCVRRMLNDITASGGNSTFYVWGGGPGIANRVIGRFDD